MNTTPPVPVASVSAMICACPTGTRSGASKNVTDLHLMPDRPLPGGPKFAGKHRPLFAVQAHAPLLLVTDY